MDTEVIHMGAGKMAEYLDFFNVYVMGVIEMAFQLYFLGKILKKKISLPFYFLFAVCAVIVCDFVPTSTITGFAALVFLLTACGILVCHADVKSSILYAALTVEIMLLCYGIVKSILALLRPWMPVVFHDPLAKTAYRDIWINFTSLFVLLCIINTVTLVYRKKKRQKGKVKSDE